MKPYTEYKDSGVEWIGEIPAGWGLSKTKYLSYFSNGYSYRSQDWQGEENGIPVIRMSNISENGELNLTEKNTKYISPELSAETRLFRINKEDVLISMTDMSPKMGLLGKTMIFPFEGEYYLNQRVGRIKIDNKKMLTKFYHYSANTDNVRNQLKQEVYPNVQFNLSSETIKSGTIPLPPLTEQTQIANFLDTKTQQIDKLIQNKQQKIKLLQEKRIAVINHAVTKGLNPDVEMKDSGVEWIGEIPVGWESTIVKRITLEHKQGYYSEEKYDDTGYKLLRITDISDDTNVDFSLCPFYELPEDIASGFLLKVGDFVFARSGTIGRFGFIQERVKSVFASYLIRFRFHKKLSSKFLKYYFQSTIFKDGLMSDLHGGANKNIHAENIKNQFVVFPILVAQQQIANFLDTKTQQIDDLISKEQRKIELLKEYRQSLISDAVTGKIDVREAV